MIKIDVFSDKRVVRYVFFVISFILFLVALTGIGGLHLRGSLGSGFNFYYTLVYVPWSTRLVCLLIAISLLCGSMLSKKDNIYLIYSSAFSFLLMFLYQIVFWVIYGDGITLLIVNYLIPFLIGVCFFIFKFIKYKKEKK